MRWLCILAAYKVWIKTRCYFKPIKFNKLLFGGVGHAIVGDRFNMSLIIMILNIIYSCRLIVFARKVSFERLRENSFNTFPVSYCTIHSFQALLRLALSLFAHNTLLHIIPLKQLKTAFLFID